MRNLLVYLPVIHRGHLELFTKAHPDYVWVFGQDLISEFPHLQRDVRAIMPEQAMAMLWGLKLPFKTNLLNHRALEELAVNENDQIIIPREDVGRALAEKYFSARNIEWHDSFLRWNRWNTSVKSKINPDHRISRSEVNQSIMAQAFEWAKRSPDWWRQVGVEIVDRHNHPIYTTYNRHLPSDYTTYIDGDPRSSFDAGESIDLSCALHGERDAIAWAARYGVALEKASLYVTTFPCPGCARTIIAAGISRIFYTDGYSLLEADVVLKVSGVEIVRVEF